MSATTSLSLDTSPRGTATYKLVVRSAEEAVRTIREKLGENARVLSVRQLPGEGIAALFRRPRLEVIAQIGGDETPSLPVVAPAAAEVASRSNWETLERATLTDRAFAPQISTARIEPSSASRAETRRPASADQLPNLLRRSGFSESLVGRLQATPLFAKGADRLLHHALADFGQVLRTSATAHPARPLPARVAFLGTAGSGRTTALCKWLAREVFTHGRTGRVLKAEFDRPNPAEGLAVFCEALGLSVHHYAPSDSGASVMPAASPTEFVYADLPGISLRAPSENAAIARFLETERIDGRVVVLNAVYDTATLRSAYAAGRDLGATHLVFTHLDELSHWGKLWDFLIDDALTPLFLATGPSLTGDLDEDAVGAVLRRTLPGA